MKKTANLELPIYDNPETDVFDLEDWNIANQNLDNAFGRYMLASQGSTAYRPTTDLFVGKFYFDTQLNKPIWYNGSNWVDAMGTTV